MLRVLLVQSGLPVKNLGGPAKFVPMLMEGIYECGLTSRVKVEAVMQNRFYKSLDFDWQNVSEKNERFATTIKKVIRWCACSLYFPAKWRHHRRYLQQCQVFQRIFENNQYDVLHAHDFTSTVLLHKWSKKLSKPLIFTNHFKGSLYREAIAPSFSYYRTPLWRKHFQGIEKESIHVADVLTFPSESGMNILIEDFPELEHLIRRKSKIIYSGIPDPKAFLGASTAESQEGQNPTMKVINVGNHIPDKGVDIALHIFRRLIDMTKMKLQFVNVGQYGPETPKLYALAKNLEIDDRAFFMGILAHREVLRMIKEAFVVLHTPRRVVFDLSLLEAMGLGRPVIASSVKGNQEALGENYPLLISPDKPELSDRQVDLLIDEGKSIGCRLRSRYEAHFTLCKMAKNYVDLWSLVA